MSVVVLTGGVGGAKFVEGLVQVLGGSNVAAIVNTGDDFTHLGLRICPDLDSVMYMLSGKNDPARGWGVVGESWNFMSALAEWTDETWFNLGDRDLALHVLRTAALESGESLTAFVHRMADKAGIDAALLPMSESPVSTILTTDIGILSFQSYFVEHQCRPSVSKIRFDGAAEARPGRSVTSALAAPDLEAVFVAPSNPYLSIDPILAVPGMTEAISAAGVPVIAISPLIGGKAVKGPTAKLMAELGMECSNSTIASHYAGLIDGLLIDRSDDCEGLRVARENTLMRNADDRKRVAEAALRLARDEATT
ncbi:LPPG--FO 2-phospho-L-lactate transferase [Novosphingobium marinum]|uniref:LPPG:FO 2-phospho-L-lactate transferase n=1 Tax=Novosphingobium marinum TaxID=1514948 RepID=A0A7Y9XVY8_9SPHN|nr:2-phospho-L-lactate transferase [Novosphingobium marinum]NYH95522.1 LPPG:FO 2-phospho-L-lactate transferase [Novosphingobium marinum]GGC27721.1 LPPG--FO 2-phospho-L-lactate transferase [Novosphingobium marinum]